MRLEKTVYSFYFPEVREAVDRVVSDFPHDEFLKNYDPGLDDAHEPLFDLYETTFADQVTGFDSFANRYYINGSSEGLFHIIARHRGKRLGNPLYQFEGEYQGYGEYAKSMFYEIENVPRDADLTQLLGGTFIISNPSAIDGNVSDDYKRVIEAGHEVILDLAYLGMVDDLDIDLSHPSIRTVVASMSKPFGLYYYRIGFCWSRDPIPSLYGNKWFKNLASIKIGEEVLRSVNPKALRQRYQKVQAEAVRILSYMYGAYLMPSDVFLLAHSNYVPLTMEEFKRGPGARYCLTPFFYEAVNA